MVQQDIGDSGSHEVMEVIGELDPQTGIYSIHQPGAAAGSMWYIIYVCQSFEESWPALILFLLDLESSLLP